MATEFFKGWRAAIREVSEDETGQIAARNDRWCTAGSRTRYGVDCGPYAVAAQLPQS